MADRPWTDEQVAEATALLAGTPLIPVGSALGAARGLLLAELAHLLLEVARLEAVARAAQDLVNEPTEDQRRFRLIELSDALIAARREA